MNEIKLKRAYKVTSEENKVSLLSKKEQRKCCYGQKSCWIRVIEKREVQIKYMENIIYNLQCSSDGVKWVDLGTYIIPKEFTEKFESLLQENKDEIVPLEKFVPKDVTNTAEGPYLLYDTKDTYTIIVDARDGEKFYNELDEWEEISGIEWDTTETAVVDREMGIAYRYDAYGHFSNVIFVEDKVLGRKGFEKGIYGWDDIEEKYLNNYNHALPDWEVLNHMLEAEGFSQRSCDFASGFYDKHDNPMEIAEKAKEKGLDYVFQVDYESPWETGFCLWTRAKKEDSDEQEERDS